MADVGAIVDQMRSLDCILVEVQSRHLVRRMNPSVAVEQQASERRHKTGNGASEGGREELVK